MTRILLLAAVIIWGWTFVATKICLDHLTPSEILAGRFLIGLPILYLLIRRLRLSLYLRAGDLWVLAVIAFIICVHFAVQVIGLQYTTASKTGWMITITPLVTAALSAIFLREGLSRWQWLGILIASIGVILLISNGDFTSLANFSNMGDWLVLLSAHTWAVYSICSRRLNKDRSPLATTFLAFVPLTLLALVSAVFSSLSGSGVSSGSAHGFASLPVEGWGALIFLGVLGTLAQWFWQTAIARIGAVRAGVYLYLEPIATTVLAIPLLHEPVGGALISGALLILGGVWLAERRA